MKKTKKLLSIILSVCMLFSISTGLNFSAYADSNIFEEISASDLKSGDIFQFGSYPQSKVNDSNIITSLNQIDCELINYGYFLEKTDWDEDDNSVIIKNFVDMSYADIIYNGIKYRKVVINEYRPYCKHEMQLERFQNQMLNGYLKENTYYFKWEPVLWKSLSNSNNGVYSLSEMVLDAQAYDNISANNWYASSLRSWLNKCFYNISFDENEKSYIQTTTLNNENSSVYGTIDGIATEDNIWVLSYSDVVNSNFGFSNDYLFEDSNRIATATDYALSQNCSKNASWWLRTPGSARARGCKVTNNGAVFHGSDISDKDTEGIGVRPAFMLNKTAMVKVLKRHTHNYTIKKVTKNPTCLTDGVLTKICSCGNILTDVIPATGHTLKTTVTKATTSNNGSKVTKCTICGTQTAKSTIYYPKAITLSVTSYTYDGKAKKPTVAVKDSNGKTISSSNYSVAYSNNKNVGKATVKITFKGNYSGTVSKAFVINPKNTSGLTLMAKSKSFVAKWKKYTTQTTGYQIRYTTDSKFKKGVKTVTVTKNGTTSSTVKKLTAKKKYYVQIRTFKTVNGTKYYSAWSGSKSVTTKK